jgi:16S rRNA G966 N2-methylase RsmD
MSISELYPGIGVALEAKSPRGATVRSPLLAPGRGSRGTPVYNVHSYHTKVPPEAIEPYITHHTRPGELVLDPFCGSGMTGVAAARLGRRAVLNDLAPAAVHIAWNVTHGCAAGDLRQAAGEILSQIDAVVSRLYAASCSGCGSPAKIAYTIWSDILACDHCGNQVTVWDGATDRVMGTMRPTFGCARCGRQSQRRGAQRQGRRPCLVATDCMHCGRLERAPVADDLALLEDISASPIDHWYPTVPIGPEREMYLRSALHLQGIRTVADFYSPRNLRVLSAMWTAIRSVDDLRLRQALALAFTNTAWHGSIMRRYNVRGGQRPLSGTLYVPHLSSEVNVARVFAHKVRQLETFFASEPSHFRPREESPQVSLGSASELTDIPDGVVDYVFTDPPFGSNIFYADCNLIWEAWLGELTDERREAVVNRSLKPDHGGKTLDDYRGLMLASFAEMRRVLRPHGWITLIFHSTNAEVWRAIEAAADEAGLTIEGATYLDKRQLSHKGYKGANGVEDVAAYDVVLAMRNRAPTSAISKAARQRRQRAAVDILRQHLAALDPVGLDGDHDARRKLPYLHSLLVQHHFNGDIGLHVGGYELVRQICEANFLVDANGRWTVLAAPGKPSRQPPEKKSILPHGNRASLRAS